MRLWQNKWSHRSTTTTDEWPLFMRAQMRRHPTDTVVRLHRCTSCFDKPRRPRRLEMHDNFTVVEIPRCRKTNDVIDHRPRWTQLERVSLLEAEINVTGRFSYYRYFYKNEQYYGLRMSPGARRPVTVGGRNRPVRGSTIRYDTRCYFNVPTWVSLIYRTEPAAKSVKTEKN